jgi:hypothetical protein
MLILLFLWGRRRTNEGHDLLMDCVLIVTDDGADLLAVLDEHEGRHSSDLIFFSDVLLNKERILVSQGRNVPQDCGGTVLTVSPSTSTVRKMAPGNSLAYWANAGAMKRQGPHHLAVKSMITCKTNESRTYVVRLGSMTGIPESIVQKKIITTP